MNDNKDLIFIPYTSIPVSSFDKEVILEKILSSDVEFSPRRIDKKVIIYGAGNLGKMAKHFFDYLKIPFLYVIDKNADKYKNEECWKDIKIVRPNEVSKKDKKECLLIMCIVSIPIIKLIDELKINGWENISHFYDISESYTDKYPLSNGWFLVKLDEKGKEAIRRVFFTLADDISRAHFVQFLAWRKLRVELLFDGLEKNKDKRFFIPEVVNLLKEDEVFADCGAHEGFIIEKFIRIVNNKYKEIYAIEPDDVNLEALKSRLNKVPNLKIVKCALSNKDGEDKFYEGFDFVSKLGEKGSITVKVSKLDSLNIPATFIKMHLEGEELKALEGSTNTIKKYRPIIAVTIYHNSDGAWKTPIFMMDNMENCKYYMRSDAWGGTGLVLYTIPKR